MSVEVLIPFLEPIKPPAAPPTLVDGDGMSYPHPSPAKIGWQLPGKGGGTIDACNHGGMGLVKLERNPLLRRPPTRPEINNMIHRSLKEGKGLSFVVPHVPVPAISPKGSPKVAFNSDPTLTNTSSVGDKMPQDRKSLGRGPSVTKAAFVGGSSGEHEDFAGCFDGQVPPVSKVPFEDLHAQTREVLRPTETIYIVYPSLQTHNRGITAFGADPESMQA